MIKSTQPAAPPPAGSGARLLTSLPAKYRLDPQTISHLAPRVELLLAGSTPAELVRRLTAGIDSAHDPVAALVRRIEGLPLPKGVPAPPRPAWCGECDERTRMRETPDDKVVRCTRCNPRAVSA